MSRWTFGDFVLDLESRQLLREDAHQYVDRAARRRGQDEADRLLGIRGLRRHADNQKQKSNERAEKHRYLTENGD